MGQLNVHLTNPDPRPEDAGSPILVVLRDTSQADTLHPTVVESSATADGSGIYDVTLEIPDGVLAADRQYSLWAHVGGSDGAMRGGDLIITENIPVTSESARQDAPPIEATLTRI